MKLTEFQKMLKRKCDFFFVESQSDYFWWPCLNKFEIKKIASINDLHL